MTEATTQAPEASANGAAPMPAEPDTPGGVPAGDRAMGIVGILFGVVIVAVGVDLVTGGAVSGFIGSLTGGGGDA